MFRRILKKIEVTKSNVSRVQCNLSRNMMTKQSLFIRTIVNSNSGKVVVQIMDRKYKTKKKINKQDER